MMGKSYQTGNGYIGNAANAAQVSGYQVTEAGLRPAPTASEEVFAAMEEARELSYRVKEAVNRFCGPTPEPVGEKPADKSPSAVFPSLRQASADTLEIVRSAKEALSRLERELQ